MPTWLTDAMKAAGANPELPADREAFRASHMTVLPA
jgi:hypothetical protein